MKKTDHAKTESAYMRFEKRSKIWAFSMVALIAASVVPYVISKSDGAKLLLIILIVLEIVLIVLVSSYIVKKRNLYLQLLTIERNAIIRTGVFKEIYDEYLHDGFEFNIAFDKLQHIEYHNNSIDILLQRNGHEFSIVIDESIMLIIIDEETDHPVKAEYQLSSFSSIEQIYCALNEFIMAHS